ncbi:MAG: hypothetical protein KJO86_01595, partial [Muriicola sp.]|nr:hypothetical protein [Muriicola sp.]
MGIVPYRRLLPMKKLGNQVLSYGGNEKIAKETKNRSSVNDRMTVQRTMGDAKFIQFDNMSLQDIN